MYICAHIRANTCLCATAYMHVFLQYLDVYVHMNCYSFCFHFICLRQTLCCITTDTVGCLYVMVNFLQNPDKRQTITCSLERDVGCLCEFNPCLISASANVMTHIISCHIGPSYNGTPLYCFCAPCFTAIHCEIYIRAHKPRLPAFIDMKDCHQSSPCILLYICFLRKWLCIGDMYGIVPGYAMERMYLHDNKNLFIVIVIAVSHSTD